jgi:hypothetical protein
MKPWKGFTPVKYEKTGDGQDSYIDRKDGYSIVVFE